MGAGGAATPAANRQMLGVGVRDSPLGHDTVVLVHREFNKGTTRVQMAKTMITVKIL